MHRPTLPGLLLLAACSTPPQPPPLDLQIVAAQARLAGPADALQPAVLTLTGARLDVLAGRTEALQGVPQIRADLVTPGFIDAHAHPIGLGRRLSELDLVGVPTYAKALETVSQDAQNSGSGWILGRGWDQNDWPDTPDGGWPLATDLDALTGERPAALRRVDGHATWANTAALTAAGITDDTPDPPGGHIVRDAAGHATGVLVDTAADLLPTPAPTAEQAEAWLRAAQDAMLAHGLVGVHDMGVDDTTLAADRRIEAAGDLKIRVFAYLTPGSDAADALLREGPTLGTHLSLVGVKAYADGALGSRGAHLSAPYADAPETTGLVLTDQAALTELATRCLRARAQLAVHAIGDQAVTDTLDAFEQARAAVPDAGAVPLRVEHAQVVRPSDRARFAALGVVASVQPTHATSDMPWAGERLGPERVRWAYTWRALEQAGANLPLGSDFPVEDVDPALGLHAAVHRTDLTGQPEGGWQPDQALTLVQAIDGFTVEAWHAVGQPVDGLAPQTRPDLTLWTHHDEAPEWRAQATFIDGVRVATRPADASGTLPP